VEAVRAIVSRARHPQRRWALSAQRPRLGDQWELKAIGERTATALQHKAKQCEYTGGQAPYGRRVAADRARLEPNPHEKAARAVAGELRAQGLTLRAVAAELERRGVRSRTGGAFAPVQVTRMVA
jgi:site-specific DNA recombinase